VEDLEDAAVGLERDISFCWVKEWMGGRRVKKRIHTTRSLKVSITLSAPSLLSKTISAITIGFVLTIRQLLINPPTGVIALSMSAAVVPGAKFCASTTNGPARPRIVKPFSGTVGATVAFLVIALGPVGIAGPVGGCCVELRLPC
jgi:hypothetical protein